YDTGEDPVVRVRAADVRKRLAQYYQSLDPDKPALHIELQPGSYKAHFRLYRSAQPTPVAAQASNFEQEQAQSASYSPVKPRIRRFSFSWRMNLLLAFIVVLVGVLSWWLQGLWKTPQERFWDPLVSAKQPVLLYLGSNAAYVFSPDYLAHYRAEHHLSYN